MKIFFAVFFLFAVGQARAAEFQTTAIFCNGPVSDGDVSGCPAFSTFMGIILKDLQSATIPMNSGETLIRLKDSSGNIWEQQLQTCNSKPSELRGCTAKVDLTKPEQVSIHISVWDIGRRAQNLALFIAQNRISLVPDGGDNLIFSLTEK